MAKFGFTLFLYLSLVLAIVASSNASTFDSHRRDHLDLGRLVRKRAATPSDQSSAQGQQTPSESSSAAQATSSAAAQSTPANSPSAQTTVEATSSAGSESSSASGLLASVTGALLPTQSSAASSATVAGTTPSAASNSAASSALQTTAPAEQVSATTPTQSVLYLTTSGAATPTQTSSDSTSSGMSHTAITVLIVIAASIGASVIVWTVIRKWKFRPSSDFDSRMQPIDWHPDGNNEDAVGRRPLSRASSFHSGPSRAPTDDEMRGIGGYGAASLNPIPDHDFTAGPAHFAPVGGYADLARGPSAPPMMQEPLGRSHTITRPAQHDQFGVPLHHGYTGY